MIIRIVAKDGSIAIDDPGNFKAFSVRMEGSFDRPGMADELLGRIAIRYDKDHAWISEQALRDWPSLKSESWWQDGLTTMMAAVEKFGWIDRENGAIRAHIEHAP
jgi:predicted transcriptional regulator